MGEASAFLPIILIVLAFYLLLIRPQSKRAKQQRQMQSGLTAGTKVMLTSGIHGELVGTELSDRVEVRVADGVVLTVARAAIATVVADEPAVVADEPVDEPVEAPFDESGREPGEDVPGRKEL